MLLKIIALNPLGYVSSAVNLFDGIIVLVSILDLSKPLMQFSRANST